MNILTRSKNKKPRISIVIIIFKMPEQAKKTLYTLSAAYQKNVSLSDYEVIVVENTSSQILGEKTACSYGKNFRYFLHENNSVSPAGAVNYGVKKANSDMVGIMIDGARMLTPGVIHNVLTARKISSMAVVSVPGYHIGSELQQDAVTSGYNEVEEEKLLRQINWPDDGYGLFEISCLSGSCANGFFNPNAESNCLCIPKSIYNVLGGCDPRFNLPGGGLVNLDLYKRVCEYSKTKLFILPGEGTFHQFHGGVTTGDQPEKRAALIKTIRQQYKNIRGDDFKPPEIDAVYLGKINKYAQKFIHFSSERALKRNKLMPCSK